MQKPCSANVLAVKVLDCMLGIVYFNLKMSMIDGPQMLSDTFLSRTLTDDRHSLSEVSGKLPSDESCEP